MPLKDAIPMLPSNEENRSGSSAVHQATFAGATGGNTMAMDDAGWQGQPLAQLAGQIMDCERRTQARIPVLLHSSADDWDERSLMEDI